MADHQMATLHRGLFSCFSSASTSRSADRQFSPLGHSLRLVVESSAVRKKPATPPFDGPFRTITTIIHGNAIGVIEEPVLPGGIPPERRAECWVVKIGAVDAALAASSPFPEKLFTRVIDDLVAFLKEQGVA